MARASIFNAILGPNETQETQQSELPPVPAYVNNYENRFRLIGLRLDNQNMKRPVIMEVPGGMLVRAEYDNMSDELFEFPDTQFEAQYEAAFQQRQVGEEDYLRIKSDLIPTSYSDVYRAIGEWLDERLARSVVISEGKSGIYVSGKMLEETTVQSRYGRFDELFTPDSVDALLTEAQQRRRNG